MIPPVAVVVPGLLLPMPAMARDGVRITVDREQSERGGAEQVRLGSTSGDVRVWGLVRRQADGREWVRWSAQGGKGRDRWILGGTRGWTGGGTRGWGNALAARGGREEPRATLAAAPVGVTWVRRGARLGWEIGGGRAFDGGADGLALLRAGTWSGGLELRRGAPSAVASWSGRGQVPAGVDVAAGGRRQGHLRAGLGGGPCPAGIVAEGRWRRGALAEWIGRAALRSGTATGAFRVGVDLRLRRGRISSDGRAEWERRRPAGGWRVWVRQRGGAAGTIGVELSGRGSPATALGVEFGGPRDRRRASLSLSGRSRGVRIAGALHARSGSGRRASISVGTSGAPHSWRARVDWRRGARPRVRVSWSAASGGRN